MIRGFRFSLRSCALAFLAWASAGTLLAHRPSEITSTARLQHGRLELTAIISAPMGNSLVYDPARPEAPELDENSVALYRARLLELAKGFFDVRAGGAGLAPEQILVCINRDHEPEFFFVYHGPITSPLVLRAKGLVPPYRDGSHVLVVYDDDENILAGKTLGREGDAAELVVTLPASAPPH